MAKQMKAAPGEAPNRPIHEVRHRNIRATIWKNPGDNGAMYSVTVSRSYRDEQNQWHDSTSFRFNDLMTLAKAISDAHTVISQLEAQDRSPA